MRAAMSVDPRAAVLAGVAAGVTATAAQLLLWSVFWDAMPGIFFRDARLAAAIVLGSEVLPPPATLDWPVLIVAAAVHFALSIIYAIILAVLVSGFDRAISLVIGALYGLALFAINMYGFTAVFPWFSMTRDWITLTAHPVFGVSAAGFYKIRCQP